MRSIAWALVAEALFFAHTTFAAYSAANVAQILYGASYYSEYYPPEIGPGRIDQDVALMKEAGITVVRMGESSWGLFEPADGHFDFAWMDRAITALGSAGIRVILGTPTYSMPAWLAHAHPKLFAQPLAAGPVGYGMRQNMNYDDPVFRRHAERIIRALVNHYRDNKTVMGWQIDNETGPNGAANAAVFADFVEYLKEKFGTPQTLNRAWLLSYWGQTIHTWKDMPRPDFSVNPSYKLEWNRYQRLRVTRYLAWQVSLVRSLCRPDQILLHDFASAMRTDVDEFEVAHQLDVVGINVYHKTQDEMDGQWEAMQGDYARALKHQNYFVTEANAQTIGWNSEGEFPPYNGQLRLDVYANVASGANMLLYWHWATLHAGLETYWKGVLGHDLQPGRAYREIQRTGAEIRRLGSTIANLSPQNTVAILYSADSSYGLSLVPYKKEAAGDWAPEQTTGYASTLKQLHRALYDADIGVDFLSTDASEGDFDRYRLVIVPSLYVSSDELLEHIGTYVHKGGHVLMTFKSGFANDNLAVRSLPAPGPLSAATGFTYQEFSNLKSPVLLKGDPFEVGKDNNVSDWAEFLELKGARALAWYDDPVIGQWPAITRNIYGAGSLTYEGTLLSDKLQYAVVREVLQESGVATNVPVAPSTVRIRNVVNADGRQIHFVFNFSSQAARLRYRFASSTDLLSGKLLEEGDTVDLGPWDLLIAQEIPGQ
jgi:beta-galactosidase